MNNKITDREQLQTILKYYLNTRDTDIGNFKQNLTENLREYVFTIQPNPTTAIDLDANTITCIIALNREVGVYYIGIGTYKEVISEYDYKNMKETYFRRLYLYENYRKSDADVDKLIQHTYDSMMEKKQSIGRNLHAEPMEMVAEENEAARPMFEEVLDNENEAIRDVIAERQDMPYDAMGTFEGPDEDRG